MAKAITRPPDQDLYEDDFPLWLERQAELLRAGRFGDLDLAHLIEEVEGLARKERHEVESRAELIVVHLLKLTYSSAVEPRRGWARTVLGQRRALVRMLTPTLRNHLEQRLAEIYAAARRMAAIEMEIDAIDPEALPFECPFTLDEILDGEWSPQNLYDLDRGQA